MLKTPILKPAAYDILIDKGTEMPGSSHLQSVREHATITVDNVELPYFDHTINLHPVVASRVLMTKSLIAFNHIQIVMEGELKLSSQYDARPGLKLIATDQRQCNI